VTTTSGSDGRVGDTEESRAFFQNRLALFSRTIGVLFGILFVAGFFLFVILPDARPPNVRVAQLLAGIGIVSQGVIAVALKRRKHRGSRLRALDAVNMITSGIMIGGGSYIVAESPTHVFVPFTLGVLLIFARVFFIPSSAKRTFVLSAACMIPLSLGDIGLVHHHPDALGMPALAYSLGGVAVGGLTVALATIGSGVIYGLREEVREARRFGQYTLDRKLGEGGMGVVYMARHALLRRPTAIKLLPPEKAGTEDIARFEREVQLTSELTHPNTIAIFDYGRSADGVFYYVMEYLDGIDLQSLVDETGPLPAGRAIRILVQICDALDEAHARGVIHRDIKPANVILCRRGQVPDFVKVVDFGLVKEIVKSDEHSANVTAAGTITGTPAYLAPEAMTDPESVGPASDLYAVGALGYFLVTGEMVFGNKTLLQICSDHLKTKPIPPSKRRPDLAIPERLEALILQCLEKKPGDRPASARAFADALGEVPALGWSKADAMKWWDAFDAKERQSVRGIAVADTIAVVPRTVANAPTLDLVSVTLKEI
jgi:eukaryotic-like serine/threonine-protein kinase